MTVQVSYFPLRGGLDVVTPWLEKNAGRLVACQNYECQTGGGYKSIQGYALYDGRTSGTVLAVPGSGPIRGVHVLNGSVYAFRDNSATPATACVMYKATTGGWVAQDLGSSISFNTGSAAISEGNTVTGGTSGATATVRRVVVTSGAWGGTPTASGRLTLYGITGTFQSGENLNVGGATKAVSTSVATANSIPAGSRLEGVNWNFYGLAATNRAYFATGLGPAFEWDGAYFTPIITGSPVDTPRHVVAHSDHLFLGFSVGSVQFSSIGEPLVFNAISGAGEIAVGDEVTGLRPVPGNVLAVLCRNSSHLIYGNNASDFQRKTFNSVAGAVPYTCATLQETFYLDAHSVVALTQTQNFGDFQSASATLPIEPLMKLYASQAVAAMAVRGKQQYRLFFNGGAGDYAKGVGVYITISNGRVSGSTMVKFPDAVYCTATGENSSGTEILFFGSADGKVFQLDTGLTFNGAALTGFLRLSFNNFKTPAYRKRFRHATFDMDAEDTVHLVMTADFDYADPDVASHALRYFDQAWGVGGLWDSSKWNEFYWDSKLVAEANMDLVGSGRNMALMIYSPGTSGGLHAINGVVVHYSDRRLVR